MAELQGKILKRLRQEKGWTQKDLAQIMQRAESTIGMWEQGRREMDYDSLNVQQSWPFMSHNNSNDSFFSLKPKRQLKVQSQNSLCLIS